MANFFGELGGAVNDIIDSLGKLFGVDIPKWAGESDIYKWVQVIRDNLGNLPASASATLSGISNRLESLQMTPIVGRLKTVVTEARRVLNNKKRTAQQALARAELAENQANALANDVANTSLGDMVRGRNIEKKINLDKAINEAKKAYQEVQALNTDIGKEK